jgi:hypothetical protein
MRAAWIILVLVTTACGEGPAGVAALRVDRAEPDHGPLVGGTLISLHGNGFGADTRVLIGGREAPLVRALGTTNVELVIPPGEQPGDTEVVAFDDNGARSIRGIFHYSDGPTITNVSPARVVGTSTQTTITVTGTGFADEEAGEPTVLLDGELVFEVTIVNDTTLTFVAPQGRTFAQPDLELLNVRGRAQKVDAIRYTPSANPGLLMFARYGSSFAVFYDPIADTLLPIPAISSAQQRMRTVFRDELGEYWGIDTSQRIGRLDLETQSLIAPVAAERSAATTLIGTQLYGIRRSAANQIGLVDRASGVFHSAIGPSLQCCGSFGIAHDGTTMWFTQRAPDFVGVVINSIDVATGTVGTPVTLTGGAPGFRIEELRFWNGSLYAITGSPDLVRIDPQTGVVTPVKTNPSPERLVGLVPYE